MHRRVRHLNPAQCGAQIALDARFITGVADGAALDTWTGRSGTSINATGTGTARPLYVASAINGRPAVDFDGTNDVMNLSGSATSLTNNVESADLMAVWLRDAVAASTSSSVVHFSTGASAQSGRAELGVRVVSSNGAIGRGRRLDADAVANSGSAGDPSTPAIIESRARWSSGNHLSALNGVTGTSANYASGAGNTSATDSLAAQIGANSANGAWSNGKIAAVVVRVPAFSDAVRRRMRHHLGFSFRIATH